MVAHAHNPTLGYRRQEDCCQLKASLSSMVRTRLKKQANNNQKDLSMIYVLTVDNDLLNSSDTFQIHLINQYLIFFL